MKSSLDQIFRQFLRFHFGRWTPWDDSNPIDSWERAKFEAWDRGENEARDPRGDPGGERRSGGDPSSEGKTPPER